EAPDGMFDGVYRTSHAMKFQISPDQARLYVDGRYVGTADDWDDHGGGLAFPFSRVGTHRVRASLPGFRDLNLQIVVSSAADHQTDSAGDELKRISKESYPKIPKVNYATQGRLFFASTLAGAQVSVDDQPAEPVERHGEGSEPLRLTGPMVHE